MLDVVHRIHLEQDRDQWQCLVYFIYSELQMKIILNDELE